MRDHEVTCPRLLVLEFVTARGVRGGLVSPRLDPRPDDRPPLLGDDAVEVHHGCGGAQEYDLDWPVVDNLDELGALVGIELSGPEAIQPGHEMLEACAAVGARLDL